MHIVGGLYRELCCVPKWDAVLGSGGRAAEAVSVLSPDSTLYTYSEDFNSESISSLKNSGIDIRLTPRPTAVVFAYFHPLSRPHIQPSPEKIEHLPTIKVSGEAVLRFGILEGDAVVDAERAVYDPQTWRKPTPFRANGSSANQLAIVLNELELISIAGEVVTTLAAQQVMEEQNAELIVLKRGIWGATVYERSGAITSIPVYRSSRVFKIGTGDVFSAIFTHYWAEKKLSPAEAADIASRSVAAYCNTGKLPVMDGELIKVEPIERNTSGSVLLLGAGDSLGQRYTMEEARFVLKDLGVNVYCPALDSGLSGAANAILILADGADAKTIRSIESGLLSDLPIVLLQEKGVHCDELLKAPVLTKASIIDDFTTAIYAAAWAAVEIRY